MQSVELEAEMALVLACCRWPPSPDRDRAVRTAAERVEWNRVLALARRHRVQGLVHHALAAATVPVADGSGDALAAEARRISTQNLRLAAESLRLVRALRKAGVPVMVMKGAALAALAYDTLALKMAWDIDVLVPVEDVEAAADVLEAAGYACALPGSSRAALTPWHAYSKESVWRHGDSGVHVELHSALVDSPAVLPGIDARGAAQVVVISPGLALPTLEPDALFAYLCVHGAASGWRRAKWLADLGALLAKAAPAEVERLYAVSQNLGAGRAAAQALLLCHQRLALDLPPPLLQTLRRDPWTRLMTRAAERMLVAPGGYDDPKETALGTMPIHLMQMMILPGWRFTLAELRRKTTPDPRLAPSLTTVGRWLYPFAALSRRVRRV